MVALWGLISPILATQPSLFLANRIGQDHGMVYCIVSYYPGLLVEVYFHL